MRGTQRRVRLSAWAVLLAVVVTAATLAFSGAPRADAADVGQPVCAAPGSSAEDVLSNAITDRTGAGWAGADSSAAVRTADGRVIWFFGDTWVGAVGADRTRDPTTAFISSSVGIQQGSCVTFLVRGTAPQWQPWWTLDGNPGVRWWPMAAFESRGRIYVTYLGYNTVPSAQLLGGYVGSYITVWDSATLNLLQVLSTPSNTKIQWGLGYAEEGGQLYVYGVTPDTWPRRWYLAKWDRGRVWQFQTVSGTWSKLMTRAAPLAGGNQFQSYPYVVPWQGGVAVFEGRGLWNDVSLDLWWAPSPIGPYRRIATHITSVPDASTLPQPYHYIGTVVSESPASVELAWNENTWDTAFFGHDGRASYLHVQSVSVPPVLHAPAPLLRYGSRGEPVVRLQGILKVRGYSPTMHVDGIYGSATRLAVMRLQRDLAARGAALKVDGIYGPATAAALTQLLAT
jgi:hypothetical protein